MVHLLDYEEVGVKKIDAQTAAVAAKGKSSTIGASSCQDTEQDIAPIAVEHLDFFRLLLPGPPWPIDNPTIQQTMDYFHFLQKVFFELRSIFIFEVDGKYFILSFIAGPFRIVG